MKTLEIMDQFTDSDWGLYRAILRTKTEDEALEEMAKRITARQPDRLTTKQINKYLKDNGVDMQLYKHGNPATAGYYYLDGPDSDLTHEQGVYGVTKLSQLTLAQWLMEARWRSIK